MNNISFLTDTLVTYSAHRFVISSFYCMPLLIYSTGVTNDKLHNFVDHSSLMLILTVFVYANFQGKS